VYSGQENALSWYETKKRRTVTGGIKAASKSGAFGESWWARRWIATLESFDIGSRLTRGKTYARAGQVVSIQIESGIVHARVQGSRATPYRVTIRTKMLSNEEWQVVAEALASQTYYAAKLIGGEMPDTIEEPFADAGLSLFPKSLNEISTDCSCPDWSNPCKHIAAVYYLLGEEFDRDPFLIFKLRGSTREAIVSKIVGASAANGLEKAPDPEPLTADPAGFWQIQEDTGDAVTIAAEPPVHAALPKRLGSLPFWRVSTPLAACMEPMYKTASRHSQSLLAGDAEEAKQ
jgi:uncharacterized Zn finger protein